MDKRNQNCKCPNTKCPHHGNCKSCVSNHHKGLHTYCKAGKPERFVRNLYAKMIINGVLQ